MFLDNRLKQQEETCLVLKKMLGLALDLPLPTKHILIGSSMVVFLKLILEPFFLKKVYPAWYYLLSFNKQAFFRAWVRSKACSLHQPFIRAACPERKTSGTFKPLKSAGLLYIGGAIKLS